MGWCLRECKRPQQDAAEQEREVNDGEFIYERDKPEATFVSEESPYLDLNVFAAELTAVLENHYDYDHAVDGDEHPDDDDEAWAAYGGASPGAPPAYRAAEANAMAMAKEPSDDGIPPEAPNRPRYVTGAFDDEAAEGW